MSNKKIRVSLLQIEGRETPILNASLIKKALIKAYKFNPDIICLPECANIMTANKSHLVKHATLQKDCPVLEECIQFAKKYNKFVSVGSLLLKQNNSSKLLNRSFFINHSGKIMAYYDKIHLFDVNINRKEVHRESKSFHKGNKVAIVTSPWGENRSYYLLRY